jgi:hypothetical protein
MKTKKKSSKKRQLVTTVVHVSAKVDENGRYKFGPEKRIKIYKQQKGNK